MDPPGPEFNSYEEHPWGPPPPSSHQFQDRDFPPPLPSHGGGFHPGDAHRHNNRHNRRNDYHHGDDFHGADDEQYHQYNAPSDEWFGANGHSRPHHLPKKRRADYDNGNYVKLFVGGVPNTVTIEEVGLLFKEYGSVAEVVLCRDKKTGHQKEFCFVKYASFEEADNAIKALHDLYIWPGTVVPVRVKYADGERERLGASKQKVYVNNMNKQATKEEIAELFSHYGTVEEVYIMADEFRQSRGCGFVGFSERDMALAAIEGLNGSYVMRGCDRPLVVRFADPKKPRQGEVRSGPNPTSVNTVISPAVSHMDNQCPSAENFANTRSVTPVISQSYHNTLQEPPYQRIQPQDSQAINQSSAPSSKTQSASVVSTKKTAIIPPSQLKSDGAAGNATVEGIPNCDWSVHVCPDGHKYYYNCMTFESRWEKPEELALHEQKLQSLSGQQPPSMFHALAIQCKRQSSYQEKSHKPVSCASVIHQLRTRIINGLSALIPRRNIVMRKLNWKEAKQRVQLLYR